MPSADIFWTVFIQVRTSALFVAKTNIEIFKIYSVSTSDMDRGSDGIQGIRTGLREPVLGMLG